jgi:hypothetical protein
VLIMMQTHCIPVRSPHVRHVVRDEHDVAALRCLEPVPEREREKRCLCMYTKTR